uniref:Protein-lysine N-methyltransferase EEF2KMT n=1 Tax=Bicyclus anynana TaxID=110368 RepID=A0A1C9EGL3_BICAN|nr:protein-lysine N-methyltransferase EEF2KMT [Bicyclus anynana]
MLTNNNVDNTTIVETLAKSFFKRSLSDLNSGYINNMTWEMQDKFLYKTIYSPLFKKYPGSPTFSRQFFKKLIELLEPEHEVHDDIYGYLCSVMDSEADQFNYCHYLIDNSLDNIVTIKETKNMVLNGTTGLRTWEAAFMLSDWALCNQDVFTNKSILELGSGVGFTGITIVKHCNVKSLVMTDFHDEVLETIHKNIHMNFSVSQDQQNNDLVVSKNRKKDIGVMKLDWSDTENLRHNLIPDVIIGADIVYDPSIFQPLINIFEVFHKRNNDVEIYIACVIRNSDTFNGFLKTLGESSKFFSKIK